MLSDSQQMQTPPPHDLIGNANMRGILWMVAAMATFAVEDGLIKRAARELPLGEVIILFGLGGSLVFGLLARRAGDLLFHPAALSRPMLVRVLFELGGRLFYFLALALTPLSTTTAILQATPVLVVLGANIFFHEQIGWRRWLAVIAGLVGVLVVLRPSSSDFSVLSLLAVAGMAGFAGRDLASRAAPASLGTRHLGLYGFLTIVAAGVLYALWDGRAFAWPAPLTAACLAAAVPVGAFAYTALMKAMRTGDIATVTPFRYSRLLFGIGLGVLWFNERVDAGMVLGCAIIVMAGLLIAWHGHATRRAAGQLVA